MGKRSSKLENTTKNGTSKEEYSTSRAIYRESVNEFESNALSRANSSQSGEGNESIHKQNGHHYEV